MSLGDDYLNVLDRAYIGQSSAPIVCPAIDMYEETIRSTYDRDGTLAALKGKIDRVGDVILGDLEILLSMGPDALLKRLAEDKGPQPLAKRPIVRSARAPLEQDPRHDTCDFD